jgi:AraC-like DNA-binding protein
MSKVKTMNLAILPELEEFIIPLQREEYKLLERNILEEGCREPLMVWPAKEKQILVDGHNRYRICSKHGMPFKTNEINFHDLEEAKIWIINNQMGRRNLNPDQMSYYRGLKYESLKKSRGGYEFVESKGQNELPTAEKIAREFNVSESTIKRDSKYTRGLNFIGSINHSLKKRILNGEVKVKKTSINILSDPEVQRKIRIIRNEKELEDKVEKIKSQMYSEIERQLSLENGNSVEAAQEYLAGKEPAFLDIDDKLRRIKGMILSNLNKAIKNKDAKALDEIRKLIDRLQDILD